MAAIIATDYDAPMAKRLTPSKRPTRSPAPGAVTIRPFQPGDQPLVVALWHACQLTRPWNNPHRDIARKLEHQPELFLVATIAGQIVGSVMAGYEGHRGWINYLAVAPDWRHRGLGRKLMAQAERRLRARGCPKINLQVRSANKSVIDFYQRLGYAPDDVISLGKRLISDAP
jgi:ribosomal protein S18 acetylase RimI-like enzyme